MRLSLKRSLVVASLLLCAGVAASALDTARGSGSVRSATSSRVAGMSGESASGVELTCKGRVFPTSGLGVFPPSALKSATGAERGSSPTAEALRALLERARSSTGHLYPAGWQLLQETKTSALFGHPPYVPGGQYVYLIRPQSSWSARNWGSCTPAVVRRGHMVATFELSPPSRPSPRSRTLRLAVQTETGCESTPHLERVELAWRPQRLTITVLFKQPRAPKPGTICAGSAVGLTHLVHLGRPLGRRTVLDGSSWPAREVR